MAGKTLEIEDLVLRIPGLAGADARRVGEEVARRLAEALQRWRMGPVPPALDLRVTVPSRTRREDLPRLIVTRILSALQS